MKKVDKTDTEAMIVKTRKWKVPQMRRDKADEKDEVDEEDDAGDCRSLRGRCVKITRLCALIAFAK